MRNILKIYDKIAIWLCSFSSDKYVHFIFGLLIAFIIGKMSFYHLHFSVKFAPLFGMLVADFIGLLKEYIDDKRGEQADAEDFLFTVIGSIIGVLLMTI